jgi:hypothetical protein
LAIQHQTVTLNIASIIVIFVFDSDDHQKFSIFKDQAGRQLYRLFLFINKKKKPQTANRNTRNIF